MLKTAVPDATVHPIMTFTHDGKTYFDPNNYDSIAHINTPRELIIRKREKDGVSYPSCCCSLPFHHV
eukprot:5342767-Pleurochrysis_carterae.AAC.1